MEMDDTDHDKREAELLARLEAERETRIAEKIAAGEIVSVPLFIVGGSETPARAQVEQAKADKLAELHDRGDRREVVFAVTMVVTGVVQHGEARDPERAPSAPTFALREDIGPPLPPRPSVTEETTLRNAPVNNADELPPLIETYVCVQIRQCQDDDDPGAIAEGWFSVDGKVLTVTDANGKYVGSRAMLKGEDARVVAKRLLRDKQAPEEEFNRKLSYPNMGLP
jgi:hypothetical protein